MPCLLGCSLGRESLSPWKAYEEWLHLTESCKFKWTTSFFRRNLLHHQCNSTTVRNDLWTVPGHEDEDQWPGLSANLKYLANAKKLRYHRSVRRMVKMFLDRNPLTIQSRQVIYLDVLHLRSLLKVELELPELDFYRQEWHEAKDVQEAAAIKLRWFRDAASRWTSGIDCKVNLEVQQQIDLDIGRTFPHIPEFQSADGQAKLRKLLTILAMMFPTVGYCQSLNFIGAMFLMIFDFHADLATAATIQWLCSVNHLGVPLEGTPLFPMSRESWLHTRHRSEDMHLRYCELGGLGPGLGHLADYYGTTLSGVRRDTEIIQKLLREKYPALAKRLDALGMQDGLSCWVTEPIMTLFVSTSLDLSTLAHLWDWIVLWGFVAPGGHQQALVELSSTFFTSIIPAISKCSEIEQINELLTTNLGELIQCCKNITRACRDKPILLSRLEGYRQQATTCQIDPLSSQKVWPRFVQRCQMYSNQHKQILDAGTLPESIDDPISSLPSCITSMEDLKEFKRVKPYAIPLFLYREAKKS